MKRIRIAGFVKDDVVKASFVQFTEIQTYNEEHVDAERTITDEYTFDALWESTLEFLEGLWKTVKGFAKMAKWSVVVVWEGLRWLWKQGAGSKKKVKEEKV